MSILSAALGAALILIVLWDAFETIVLPRRVTRRIRMARLFYRLVWRVWTAAARPIGPGRRQENFLGYFGPISLILLLGAWAWALITGFALLHWSAGSAARPSGGPAGFATDLYLSATTFFTLGLGDVAPVSAGGRVLTAVESGLGFGFLALVIGYLPSLNQSFSRREVSISLLDARAGSPPTAAEMLGRHGRDGGTEALRELFQEWEGWSAEFLELHLSYPVLVFFRSQHDNQSWLAALTAVLDASAFAIAGLSGGCRRQARLTFAMARHAVVDLAQVFGRTPREPEKDRLPPESLVILCAGLRSAGLGVRGEKGVAAELAGLRRMYEPLVESLAEYLRISVPPWIPEPGRTDNWESSAWDPRPARPGEEPPGKRAEHF